MILLNPKQYAPWHLDDRSAKLMRDTIAFFEAKGKRRLKKDDHDRVWYADFLESRTSASSSPTRTAGSWR
jgi:acyl-CoA dehydrogenase